MSLPGLICLVLAAIGIIGITFTCRRRTPEAMLTLFATLLLTFMSARHYPLFALTLIVAGGEHITDVWNRFVPALDSRSLASRGLTAVSLALALLWLALSFSRVSCIPINPQYFPFPARVVALLKQSGFRGNLAVPFTWGEYAIWHLGPRVKVSIDGRRETVYSDAVYRETLDFERGTGAWDALLKSSSTDLVLTHIGSPTANLMSHSDGWLPLYHDTFCVIFIRAHHPTLERILETPVPELPDNGDGLCFPAPGRRQKTVPLRRPDACVRNSNPVVGQKHAPRNVPARHVAAKTRGRRGNLAGRFRGPLMTRQAHRLVLGLVGRSPRMRVVASDAR